jgi:hypothetical protein
MAPAAGAATATFGKTTVGGLQDGGMFANYKIVHKATLSVEGSVTKLSVYAIPGINSPNPQSLKAVIYRDSGGLPSTLVASGSEVVYRGNVNGTGWLDLPLGAPVLLEPGTYWLGFITGTETEGMGYAYDFAASSRAYNSGSVPTNPFGAAAQDSEQASIYATYTPASGAPLNTSPPTITGTAQQGLTLTEQHGSWTNNPSSFSYQWLQCDGLGGGCLPIAEARGRAYLPVAADVGHTLKVEETASNAGATSSAAISSATAPVTSQGSAATFGKTTIGAMRDANMVANYKIVHRATLSVEGSVTKLSVYAVPGIHSPNPQSLRAVIYRDSGGLPSTLVASGSEVIYRGNVNGTGWLDLPFAAPVLLAPGTYWLGFITGGETGGMGYAYDFAAGSRAYNSASGPTSPFGAAAQDAEQASIYATYTPASGAPLNTSPPTISGTAQQGQVLTASPGVWSGSPTGFGYQWLRCDSAGAGCSEIVGATAASYVLGEGEVGRTVRVAVTASNEAGPSAPVSSAQTAVVVAGGGVQHLEYVVQDGVTSVYDMDHEYKLVKTISLPSTKDESRGVTVAPSTHVMFVMHGGDGPVNGSGNGSVLAYDLVGEKVLWDVKLSTGIDSGQVSPDATKLYIPTGENTNSGVWNILSASNGELLGTIQGGSGAHNTVVANNGQYVYMGGRLYNYLDVYETASGKVKQVGPMVGTVRPLTVNGSNTLAFTTATNFDGFQVSSITTGKVLFTVSFGTVPNGFRFTAPSHGISLSPDEKQVYVIDAVNKQVQFWDVSKVKEGVAPTQIGVVKVAGLDTALESPCVYDCTRGGWLQLSVDGRFLFVGDSGEVIETATRKVITTLSTLAQTKKSIEVDWQNGTTIATSGRSGVGQVP